jgi:hypothetical protein
MFTMVAARTTMSWAMGDHDENHPAPLDGGCLTVVRDS